jgi:hypothetical protein
MESNANAPVTKKEVTAQVDSSAESPYHTIGKASVQAAAGNHNHDAAYSAPEHTHADKLRTIGYSSQSLNN